MEQALDSMPLPEAERKRRETIIDRHPYREQIEAALLAGWSPRNIDQWLRRLYPDYQPVNTETLKWYRRERLKGRMRPLEAFERKLEDEHLLLDPIREIVILIALQKARVQKAIDLEERLEGVVLPVVGAEIERLAKFSAQYVEVMRDIGYLDKVAPPSEAQPLAGVTVNVNIQEVLAQQVNEMPPELRREFAALLEKARVARMEARIAAVDERVIQMLPEPNGGG